MASYRGRFLNNIPGEPLPDSAEPQAAAVPQSAADDDLDLLDFEPIIFSRDEFNPPAAEEAPSAQPDAVRFTAEDFGLDAPAQEAPADLDFTLTGFMDMEDVPQQAPEEMEFNFTLSDFMDQPAPAAAPVEEEPIPEEPAAEEVPPMDYTFSEFVLPEMKLSDEQAVTENSPAPAEEEPDVPVFRNPPVRRRPSQPRAERPARKKAEKPTALAPAKPKAAAPVKKKETAVAPAQPKEISKNTRRKSRKKFWNRSFLLLYLWIAVALPEFLLHVSTAKDGSLFNSGLILPLLFAAVPALIVYGITLLIPNRKVNFGICVGYSALFLLLCGSQKVYYAIFGTYYSAYSMANGGDAFQFVDAIFGGIWDSLFIIILMLLPTAFLILLGRKNFSFKKMKHWQGGVAPIAAGIVLQLLLVLILPIFGGTDAMSAYDLYHNTTDSYAGINKLGLATAFRLDVTRTITGQGGTGSLDLDIPDSTQGDDTTPPESTGDTPPVITGDNVMDINFKAMINKTNKADIQELHQYFMNRTPTNKNEKTGMFEGCNLILICAEGFSDLAVTEERMPTLYKMMHEGFNFTNYYVPIWGVSTTDGEYSFLTGTVPKAGCWSFYRTADEGAENYMPLTMAQQLINQGYNAYAYHGHTYDYYHRDLYLQNLGYNYKGYGNGLDIKYHWPSSDVEVIEASVDDYLTKEPFTAYYMTISGHLKYTFSGNAMAVRNKELVANEPYSDNVKAYLSCQLEFEKSMTLLLEKLEAAGVLDNTVIVITADHYPYGLTNEEVSELLGHEVETNFELYENQCIIYKPGMKAETIDEPCSSMDLLPTLSNLFGLEFDSRLYMGRDIFSDAEPFVMFQNRSWITDKAMYNASTKEVISLTGEEISSDYVKAHSKDLNNRFTVSARVLDYDYWRILFG